MVQISIILAHLRLSSNMHWECKSREADARANWWTESDIQRFVQQQIHCML